MADKKKYRMLGLALAIFVVFCAVSGYALHATSTTEFCSFTCHEMNQHNEELKYSSHFKDKDGADVGCAQCHLPPASGPKYLATKTYMGMKDLIVKFIIQPDDFVRAEHQPVARRFIDDRSCLKCHEDLQKDATGQNPITALGKIAHDAYNNGQAKSNCAGCHINLAHLPAQDRRLPQNADFAKRLDNKQAYVQKAQRASQ
jgi:nitrate/TMAO reductase-like tetraheme cytochrome c subunit